VNGWTHADGHPWLRLSPRGLWRTARETVALIRRSDETPVRSLCSRMVYKSARKLAIDVFHAPAWCWPSDDRRSRIVFITRRVLQRWVEALFEAIGAEVRRRPSSRAVLMRSAPCVVSSPGSAAGSGGSGRLLYVRSRE